jgi:AraC-like DNA-binding protein
MTRKRLGDIHAALLASDDQANIADIAQAHGFLELGRFAATYRRTFGELPSDTLRRRR